MSDRSLSAVRGRARIGVPNPQFVFQTRGVLGGSLADLDNLSKAVINRINQEAAFGRPVLDTNATRSRIRRGG